MAEENILSISLKEYKKQIEDLKSSMLGLSQTSDEYKQKVSQVQAMQGKLNSVLTDCKSTNNAVQGSYNALTAELAKLRQEWKSTGDEVTRANIGEKMLSINNQLKSLDASVGNYQRNVGDYANQFKAAFSSMGGSIEGTFNTLQGLTSIVPNLGTAFLDAGAKMKTMMASNPILLAISVALGAIVAICNKFKSAVSKNSDLQKRWNANLAAFKPILNIINKAFDMLASAIMDGVDWVMEHIPTLTSFISKVVSMYIGYARTLVNAILFIPTTMSKAMASVIQIVGKGAKKIGDGVSSILSFFGMDEQAEKVKNKMNEMGDSITDFGDSMLQNINTFRGAIDDFFDSADARQKEFLDGIGKQMVASRENAKEQQKLAKDEIALNKEVADADRQNTQDRINLKKARTKAEKDAIRAGILARNEELAQKQKQLATEKYLAKKAELDNKRGVLSKEDKTELRTLELAMRTAGTDRLSKNIEITQEVSVSNTTEKSAKEAGKKIADKIGEGLNENISKVYELVNKIDFGSKASDFMSNLKGRSSIREQMATYVKNYLGLEKTDENSGLLPVEELGYINNSLHSQMNKLNTIIDSMLRDLLQYALNADKESDEVNTAIKKIITSYNYGDGVNDVKMMVESVYKVAKENGVTDNTLNSIKQLSNDWFKELTDFTTEFNENLGTKLVSILGNIDTDNPELKQYLSRQINLIQGLDDYIKEVRNNLGNAIKNAEGNDDFKQLLKLLSPSLSDKDIETYFDGYSDSAVEKMKKVLLEKAKDPLLAQNLYMELIKAIGTTAESVGNKQLEYAVKTMKNIGEIWGKGLADGFSEGLQNTYNIDPNSLLANGGLSALNGQYMVGYENDWSDAYKDHKGSGMTKGGRISALSEKWDDKDLDKEISTSMAKIEAAEGELNSLYDQLQKAKEQQDEAAIKTYEEAYINKKMALDELQFNHLKLLNKKESKEYSDKQKKITKYTSAISKCFQNVGSVLSTVSSMKQDSINRDLENSKLSEEEAKKEWKRTQSMAIAGAILSTLGTAVSVQRSVWADESIRTVAGKLAMIGVTLAPTIASMVAQIQQMKSTNPSSSSTSSVGGSAASISSVAVTPILDENQDINTIQQIKSGNIGDKISDQKVYILESDIQKSNKRVSIREKESTF